MSELPKLKDLNLTTAEPTQIVSSNIVLPTTGEKIERDKYNFDTYNHDPRLVNFNDLNAYNQSTTDKILNGLFQAGETFGNAVVQGAAALISLPYAAISQATGSDESFMTDWLRNPVMSKLNELDVQFKQEIAPIRMTDKTASDPLSGWNMYSGFTNGVGFLASVFVPMGLMGKTAASLAETGKFANLLFPLSKGVAADAKLVGGLLSAEKAVSKLAGKTDDILSLKGKLEGLVNAGKIEADVAKNYIKYQEALIAKGELIGGLYARVGESAMESYGSYIQIKDELTAKRDNGENQYSDEQIDQIAKAKADGVFMGNMVLALSDINQFKRLFKFTNNKYGLSFADGKAIPTNLNRFARIAKGTGTVLRNMAQEGGEELFQYGLQQTAKKLANNDGLDSDNSDWLKGAVENTVKGITEPEGQASFILGAILGGGMTALGTRGKGKKYNENSQQAAALYNNYNGISEAYHNTEESAKWVEVNGTKQLAKDYANRINDYTKLEDYKNAALANGDSVSAEQFSKLQHFYHVSNTLIDDRFDDYLAKLNELKKAKPEEVYEFLGYKEPIKDEFSNEVNPQMLVNDVIQEANKFKELHEIVQSSPIYANLSFKGRQEVFYNFGLQKIGESSLKDVNNKLFNIQSESADYREANNITDLDENNLDNISPELRNQYEYLLAKKEDIIDFNQNIMGNIKDWEVNSQIKDKEKVNKEVEETDNHLKRSNLKQKFNNLVDAATYGVANKAAKLYDKTEELIKGIGKVIKNLPNTDLEEKLKELEVFIHNKVEERKNRKAGLQTDDKISNEEILRDEIIKELHERNENEEQPEIIEPSTLEELNAVIEEIEIKDTEKLIESRADFDIYSSTINGKEIFTVKWRETGEIIGTTESEEGIKKIISEYEKAEKEEQTEEDNPDVSNEEHGEITVPTNEIQGKMISINQLANTGRGRQFEVGDVKLNTNVWQKLVSKFLEIVKPNNIRIKVISYKTNPEYFTKEEISQIKADKPNTKEEEIIKGVFIKNGKLVNFAGEETDDNNQAIFTYFSDAEYPHVIIHDREYKLLGIDPANKEQVEEYIKSVREEYATAKQKIIEAVNNGKELYLNYKGTNNGIPNEYSKKIVNKIKDVFGINNFTIQIAKQDTYETVSGTTVFIPRGMVYIKTNNRFVKAQVRNVSNSEAESVYQLLLEIAKRDKESTEKSDINSQTIEIDGKVYNIANLIKSIINYNRNSFSVGNGRIYFKTKVNGVDSSDEHSFNYDDLIKPENKLALKNALQSKKSNVIADKLDEENNKTKFVKPIFKNGQFGVQTFDNYQDYLLDDTSNGNVTVGTYVSVGSTVKELKNKDINSWNNEDYQFKGLYPIFDSLVEVANEQIEFAPETATGEPLEVNVIFNLKDEKADIERRRQEAIKGLAQAIDGTWATNASTSKSNPTAYQVSQIQDWFIDLGKDKKEAINQINAKYDAKLAALEEDNIDYEAIERELEKEGFYKSNSNSSDNTINVFNENGEIQQKYLNVYEKLLNKENRTSQEEAIVQQISKKLEKDAKEFEDNSDEAAPFRLLTKPYLTIEDFNKLKKWWAATMPAAITLQSVRDLIDGVGLGQLKGSIVSIFEGAEEGTGFHEAFEVIWNYVLSEKEKAQLVADFKKRDLVNDKYYQWAKANYKGSEEKIIKEAIAEEFREEVLNNFTVPTKNWNFWTKLWDRIKTWFNLLFKGSNQQKEIFRKIQEGYYKDAKLPTSLTASSYSIATNGLKDRDGSYTSMMMEAMTSYLFYDIFENDKHTVEQFFNGEVDIKKSYVKALKWIKSKANTKKAQLIKDKKIHTREYIIANQIVEDVEKNEVNLISTHSLYLKKYSINFQLDGLDEDGNNDEEVSKIDWNIKSIDFSATKTVSREMKLLLQTIPKIDKDGNIAENNFLLPETCDSSTILKSLFNSLEGLTTYEEIYKHIVDKYDRFPELKKFVERLKLTEEETEEIFNNKKKLQQTFAKTKNSFWLTLYNTNQDSVSIVEGTTQNIRENIKKTWGANFALANRGDKLTTVYRKNKRGEPIAYQVFDTKVIPFNVILTYEQSIDFLKYLGINFSYIPEIDSKEGELLHKQANYISEALHTSEGVTTNELFYGDEKNKGKSVSKLADLEGKLNDTVELMYRNTDGKTEYAITLNTYLSTITNAINNLSKEELFKRFPQLNTIFTRNSIVLKENRKVELGFIRSDKVDNEGLGNEELPLQQKVITAINMILSKQIYPNLKESSKTLYHGFQFGEFVKHRDINDIDLQWENLKGYIQDELDTIEKGNPKNVSGKPIIIKNYDNHITDFRAFSFLSDELRASIIANGVDKNEEQIKLEISEYFNRATYKLINNLKQIGVIEAELGLDPAKKSDVKDIKVTKLWAQKKDNIDEFADKYDLLKYAVINRFYSMNEITKLYIGDLAFQKDFTEAIKRNTDTAGAKYFTANDTETIAGLNKYYPRFDGGVHTNTIQEICIEEQEKKDLNKDIQEYRDKIVENVRIHLFNKIKYVYESIGKEISDADINKKVDEELKSYKDINVTDGASIIMPDAFRSLMVRNGKWTPELNKAFIQLIQNKDESVDMSLQVLKLQYAYVNYLDGLAVKDYRKLATMVAFPTLFEKNSPLEQLYNRAFETKSDFITYGAKVGQRNLNNFEEVIKKNGIIKTNQLDWYGLGIQVDNNVKDNTKINIITQLEKHILTNFADGGKLINGKIEGIYNQIKLLKKTTLDINLNELKRKLKVDENNNVKVSNVIDLLIEESRNRDISENAINSLIELKDYQKNYPLDLTASYDAIEPIIHSVFNKTIKYKKEGISLVAVPDFGFKKFEDKALKFYFNDVNEIIGLQVRVSENVLKTLGLTKDQIANIALKSVCARIPVQGLNSIEFVEIVGTLPKQTANTVAVPIGLTAKDGGDFDFDKLFFYLPSLNKQGEILPFYETPTEEQKEELFEEYFFSRIKDNKEISKLKKQLAYEQSIVGETEADDLFSAMFGTWGKTKKGKDVLKDNKVSEYTVQTKQIIAELEEKLNDIDNNERAKYQIEFNNLSIEEQNGFDRVNNKLLELYYNVLNTSESLMFALTPNSSKDIKAIGLKLNKAWSKNRNKEDKLSPNSTSKNKEFLKAFDIFENELQAFRNQSGKKLVGRGAINASFRSLLQIAGITFNRGTVINFEEFNTLNIDGIDLPTLSKRFNKSGEVIADNISESLTGTVDVEKDPDILADINYNEFTEDVISVLNDLGVDKNVYLTLMRQPVIEKLTNQYFRAIFTSPKLSTNNRLKEVFRQESDKIKANIKRIEEDIKKEYDYKTKKFGIKDITHLIQNIENFGKEYVSNTLPSNLDALKFLYEQRQILNDFKNYKGYAQQVTSLKLAANPDTKATYKDLGTLKLQNFKRQEMLAKSTLINAHKLFDETFIGDTTNAVSELTNYLKSLQFTETVPIIEKLTSEFRNEFQNTNDYSKIESVIKKDYLLYVIASLDKTEQGKLLSNRYRELFLDNNTNITKRVIELKKELESKKLSNKFIEQLYPLLSNNEIQPNNIAPLSSLLDNQEVDIIASDFLALYQMDEQLAEDIMRVIIMQSGFNWSPVSMYRLIPSNKWVEFIKNIYDIYQDVEIDNEEEFYHQFYKNNLYNRLITKEMKIGDNHTILDEQIANNVDILTFEQSNKYPKSYNKVYHAGVDYFFAITGFNEKTKSWIYTQVQPIGTSDNKKMTFVKDYGQQKLEFAFSPNTSNINANLEVIEENINNYSKDRKEDEDNTEENELEEKAYNSTSMSLEEWKELPTEQRNKIIKKFKANEEQSTETKSNVETKQNNGQTKLFGLDLQNQGNLEFHINTLNIVSQFLQDIGVEQRLVTKFLQQDGSVIEGALAAANFLEGTVDIIEDFEKRPEAWNKLPEEAAHWWYRLLKNNTQLKQALWNNHKTYIKTNQLIDENYANQNPETLSEEAIGQLIAESIKRIQNNKGNPEDYSFFKKLLEWINSILAKFKKLRNDPFEVAAMKILSSDMTNLLTWEEYRKLNNIVNFADVLTEQSVAPIDYTLISDIGRTIVHSDYSVGEEDWDAGNLTYQFVIETLTHNDEDGYMPTDWTYKNSPKFNSQEKLDMWVFANIKEYDKRQKDKIQEVKDNQQFFDRLLNKTFRKRSKFLPKTLAKYFTIVDSQNLNNLNDWNVNSELQKITNKLTVQEKEQIVRTNNYTNIAPTLKVLPDLLNKYKKNPIVLSESVKLDGAKKQELSILNGIKDMIKLENPNLRTITVEQFVNEVHNWLETNYLLGFGNEQSYISYRTDQTFKYLKDRQTEEDIYNLTDEQIAQLPIAERQRLANIVGLTKQNPDVYHNKISLRFNDNYHTKNGHFPLAPSAWGNLTYFYTGNSKLKDAVLLHEIQNDNIEHLREFKAEKVDLDVSLNRYLQQLNINLQENIQQIESGGKKIQKTYITENIYGSYNKLNNYLKSFTDMPFGDDVTPQNLNRFKETINEQINLFKSGGVQNNLEVQQNSLAAAYANRRLWQSFIRNGGLKSILSSNDLMDLKEYIQEINTRPTSTNNEELQEDDTYLVRPENESLLKQKKQSFYNKASQLSDKINKKIIELHGRTIGFNFQAPAKPLPKAQRNMRTVRGVRTGGASNVLNDNIDFLIAFNEKQYLNNLSKQIEETKKAWVFARNATVANNFNEKLVKITLEQYANLIENYKYNQDLLNNLVDIEAQKSLQKQTIPYTEENNKTNQIEIHKKQFENLMQDALLKKEELEKDYGKIEEEVKQLLEVEMNYFTPLVHHLIQKHIQQYGKDFPMYFSGHAITKLTQGNDRTALIYAGKDEIQYTEQEVKQLKLQAAKRLHLTEGNDVEDAIKMLNQFKRESKQNMDRVIYELMNLSNNKPIETGALYNAMSQISGIKLIWKDSIKGLQSNVGGYLVDLSNYNYNTPILYGLQNKTKQDENINTELTSSGKTIKSLGITQEEWNELTESEKTKLKECN